MVLVTAKVVLPLKTEFQKLIADVKVVILIIIKSVKMKME